MKMATEKRLTVGELRKALEGVPDELEVHFSSDTEEAYEIILTQARRVKYELPNGQRFEDTGETGVDYFDIYGNAADEDEDEDYE
jgi:hypothetical protein